MARIRKAWTRTDDGIARRMLAAGKTQMEIACVLGRNYDVVNRKVQRIRAGIATVDMKRRMPTQKSLRPWTPQQEMELRSMAPTTHTNVLAAHFKRSRIAIERKLSRMGVRAGEDCYTMRQMMSASGYDHSQLLRAIASLGITPTLGRQRGRVQAHIYSDDQYEQIIAWFRTENAA